MGVIHACVKKIICSQQESEGRDRRVRFNWNFNPTNWSRSVNIPSCGYRHTKERSKRRKKQRNSERRDKQMWNCVIEINKLKISPSARCFSVDLYHVAMNSRLLYEKDRINSSSFCSLSLSSFFLLSRCWLDQPMIKL